MILKISRNELKSADKEEFDKYLATLDKGCWIIGEIEVIHHRHISKKDVEGRYDFSGFYDIRISHLTREKRLSTGALEIQIKFSDPSKDLFNIILQDCVCFICNENGKTIDKLKC